MAEPLSREERDHYLKNTVPHSPMRAWEATVRAEEAGRKAAEERAERLRAALATLKVAHDALISAVTPPGCVEVPSDEYDALFSEWHAATRACIAALAADDAARGS